MRQWQSKLLGTTLAAIATASAGVASAAVPATSLIEGSLTSTGGGPAADGSYQLTFSIYKDGQVPTPYWTEGPVAVTVKNGAFAWQLGSATPIDPAALAQGAWLSLKVASDPELPRKPLNSSMYALRAAVAENVDPGVLAAFPKKTDLAGVALSGNYADLAGTPNLAGYAKTASLAAVATTGSYSDLSNKPVAVQVGQACGTGLVVNGIAADGSLQCVAGGASNLPNDGIGQVSNGLVNVIFTDAYSNNKAVDIPDNNPIGVADTVAVPDNGLAQKLTVSVKLTNSDLGFVKILLYDPANTEYVLCGGGQLTGAGWSQPCGKAPDGLDTAWPDPNKTLSGDLTTWVGKNPKGNWILKVVDAKFLNNGVDGQVQSWAVKVQTLSNKKVQVKGDLIVDGKLSFANSPDLFKQAIFQTCDSTDTNGPCFTTFTAPRTFLEAAKFCAAQKGDLCTDSQTYAGRIQSTYMLNPSWSNSYADNDGGQWNVANGGTGDDHPDSSSYGTACCFNWTPKQPNEQTVNGVRVLKIANSNNFTWDQAVKDCESLQSDLCDKSQYYVLRAAGKISAAMWASDHSDNDGGVCNSSVGGTNDDTNPGNKYGYACCATNRTSLACPTGATEIGGICVAKITNTGTSFTSASSQCASLGARLCSISQTAVLRSLGQITSPQSWTGSHSDNDGNQLNAAIGSTADNPTDGASYGWACCY